MGKAPLILKYLHDHARLVCDRRNEKDGPGTWRITPIPDDHRRNIIYNYGSTENFEEFFSNKQQTQLKSTKVNESPTLNYCEINLKSLERREMTRMTERRVTKESRITLKRNTSEQKQKTGIFSNGIQANNRILIPSQQSPDEYYDNYQNNNFNNSNNNNNNSNNNSSSNNNVFNQCPSTSSIYLASSDYEDDLFNEPNDIEMAQYHHQRDLYNHHRDLYNTTDWFDNTANFTQSQSPKHVTGFVPRHRDHYKFHSQR